MKIRVPQQIDLGVYRVTVEADRSVLLVPEGGARNAPSVEVDALIEVPGGPLDGFYRVAQSREDGSVVIRRETSGQVVETILATSVDDEDLLDARLARLDAALARRHRRRPRPCTRDKHGLNLLSWLRRGRRFRGELAHARAHVGLRDLHHGASGRGWGKAWFLLCLTFTLSPHSLPG